MVIKIAPVIGCCNQFWTYRHIKDMRDVMYRSEWLDWFMNTFICQKAEMNQLKNEKKDRWIDINIKN